MARVTSNPTKVIDKKTHPALRASELSSDSNVGPGRGGGGSESGIRPDDFSI